MLEKLPHFKLLAVELDAMGCRQEAIAETLDIDVNKGKVQYKRTR